MRNRRRREAGLTLVEMLIAMVLLALVLLAIAPLFIASVKSNYSANEYTSIHNLARDRLEQLMNLPITDAQLTSGPHPLNDLPPTLPDPVTGIPPSTVRNPLIRSYTVQNFVSTPPAVAGNAWVLTAVAPPGSYEFKRIDVTVTSVNDPVLLGPSRIGFGQRTARVSGFLRNTDPAGPGS